MILRGFGLVLRADEGFHVGLSRPQPWTRPQSQPPRADQQCLQRFMSHKKVLFQTGKWTVDEDQRLAEAVALYSDNWTLVAQHVETQTANQCRLRYVVVWGRG